MSNQETWDIYYVSILMMILAVPKVDGL
jgi:hypothetical protein